MEKTNYRRRTSAKRSNTTEEKNIKEVLLNQTITSSIIIASVLAISIIKTNFTNNIKAKLSSTISNTTTLEEVFQSGKQVTAKYLDIINSVKTIFGNNQEIPKSNTSSEEQTILNDTASDRVDTDALGILGNGDDVADEKKPIVSE